MQTLRSISDLSNVPKTLFQRISLLDRINTVLEDLNLPSEEVPEFPKLKLDLNTYRRRAVFHASSVGSQSGKSLCGKWPMGCGRELYYSYCGEPGVPSWEPRNRRILDTGSAVHLQLQTYLLAAAARSDGEETFTMEVDVNPDTNPVADLFDLSGHTDGIYEVNAEDCSIRVGVEIKTINDNGYKGLGSPHKEHTVQATIYQKCLDLPIMVFLYYNKNDSSIAEFHYSFEPAIWDAVEAKINYIRECAIKQEEPEQESSRSCIYCKYRNICKPHAARARAFTR